MAPAGSDAQERVTIRAAAAGDFVAIQAIEVEAGLLFAEIGMQAVADDPPFSLDELAAFVDAGLAWVALDRTGRPAGYLVGLRVDGRAHIEQLSVRPSHGRRGIGRALVGHFVRWATGEHLPAITLTTFADVPWNAPYYARLGFRPFDVDASSPGLQRIRAAEAAHGLDRWPRVAMILDLDEVDGGRRAIK
jgi:GNAT superfamily N-acetyltransferase